MKPSVPPFYHKSMYLKWNILQQYMLSLLTFSCNLVMISFTWYLGMVYGKSKRKVNERIKYVTILKHSCDFWNLRNPIGMIYNCINWKKDEGLNTYLITAPYHSRRNSFTIDFLVNILWGGRGQFQDLPDRPEMEKKRERIFTI